MRVCFISHLSEMTGAELSMLESIEGLMTRGVECQVVVPTPARLLAELVSRCVAFHVSNFHWWVNPQPRRGLCGLKDQMRVVWHQRAKGHEIARRLSYWKPDVVVTNTVCMAVGAFAARKLCVAHVWNIH